MSYLITSSLLAYLAIPILFWIFKNEEDYKLSLVKKRFLFLITIIYIGFALFPLLQGRGDGMFLSFTVLPLLYICVLRGKIRAIFEYFRKNIFLLAIPIFLLLILEESFLALGYHISGLGAYTKWNTIALHLLSYAGLYIGYAVIIVFFYSRYKFSLWQLFLVGGLYGLLVEQEFEGLKMLFSGEFLSLLFYVPIIFLTYGLYLLWPKVVFSEELKGRIHSTRWHALLLFIGISIVPIFIWLLLAELLKLSGVNTSSIF